MNQSEVPEIDLSESNEMVVSNMSKLNPEVDEDSQEAKRGGGGGGGGHIRLKSVLVKGGTQKSSIMSN